MSRRLVITIAKTIGRYISPRRRYVTLSSPFFFFFLLLLLHVLSSFCARDLLLVERLRGESNWKARTKTLVAVKKRLYSSYEGSAICELNFSYLRILDVLEYFELSSNHF